MKQPPRLKNNASFVRLSNSFTAREEESKVSMKDNSNLCDILMEDRRNDWLAKQLREEEKILRKGDFLDLGASHSKSCDANQLKLFHIQNCDTDDVDEGEI